EIVLQVIAVAVTVLGIYTGYALYNRYPAILERWKQSVAKMRLRNFLLNGWDFDLLYDTVLVKPFTYITGINKLDVFDNINKSIATVTQRLNQNLSATQNGSLRWYIAGALIGIIFILTLQIFL